jgi:hypothetical protein
MSWYSDLIGVSEADTMTPSDPNSWGGTVSSATSGGVTPASASGLLGALGSTIGSVADFGFNVQKFQLGQQAQANDLSLQALKANLGYKTAVTQATAQSQIAGYQSQGAVAQAARAAGISTGGISTTMLLVLAIGAYVLVNKK